MDNEELVMENERETSPNNELPTDESQLLVNGKLL